MAKYIIFALFSGVCCLIAHIIFKVREKRVARQTLKDVEYVQIIAKAIELESIAKTFDLEMYPAIRKFLMQNTFLLEHYHDSPESIKIELNNLDDMPEDHKEYYNSLELETRRAPGAIADLVNMQLSILERMFIIQNKYIFRLVHISGLKKNILLQILSFSATVLDLLSWYRVKNTKVAKRIKKGSKAMKSLESEETHTAYYRKAVS